MGGGYAPSHSFTTSYPCDGLELGEVLGLALGEPLALALGLVLGLELTLALGLPLALALGLVLGLELTLALGLKLGLVLQFVGVIVQPGQVAFVSCGTHTERIPQRSHRMS